MPDLTQADRAQASSVALRPDQCTPHFAGNLFAGLRILGAVALVAFGALAAGPPLRVSEADAKKAAIEKPAPEYPVMARQLKISGRVELEASVDESGRVQEVKIINGNAVLTKPATEAVKKWRFRPFEAGGKPVPATVSLSFEFGAR